jgi:uncharacterized membrane protein
MVNQSPKDTPFGLDPNVAAGLAYLLGLIGGIIMLVGGGTNRFVKWAACQSITLSAVYIGWYIVVGVVDAILGMGHLWPLIAIVGLVSMIVSILFLVAWLWTWITAFQGKEVRLPFVADLTERFFGSQLASV